MTKTPLNIELLCKKPPTGVKDQQHDLCLHWGTADRDSCSSPPTLAAALQTALATAANMLLLVQRRVFAATSGRGKHRPPCVATAVLRPWEELIGVESGVDQLLPLLTKTPTPPSPAFISQLNGLTPCYFLISDFSPAVVGKRGHIFSVFISMFSFRFWRVDRKKENNLNCEIRKTDQQSFFYI